jgi:hypothetical protein
MGIGKFGFTRRRYKLTRRDTHGRKIVFILLL